MVARLKAARSTAAMRAASAGAHLGGAGGGDYGLGGKHGAGP